MQTHWENRMKKPATWLSTLLVLSILLNGALFYRFIIAGNPPEKTDQRITLTLNEGERELVLSEMRQFLVALQGITVSANNGKMEEVAKHARAVGSKAAGTVPGSLMMKLPLEFKQLGLATHNGFDAIALDAESLGDGPHAMEQLGRLMSNCIACHASYQIRPAPPKL